MLSINGFSNNIIDMKIFKKKKTRPNTTLTFGLIMESGVNEFEQVEFGINHAESDIKSGPRHKFGRDSAIGAVDGVIQRVLEV